MTLLLELEEKLRDTNAAIAQHEKAMAASKSPSLAVGLRSLQTRFARLEAEFTSAAEQLGVDVCSYRLFGEKETGSLPAVAIFGAIEAFQNVFSVVYDAVRRGPRVKPALTPDLKQESEFQFGYAFNGSVGIVLTMNNKQFLMETALDQSMEALFDLARSQSPEEVLEKSRTLGAAVVKAAHRWAASHVNAGVGADVKWIRGHTEKSRLIVQVPQLSALMKSLAAATEDMEDTVVLTGVLVGTETSSSRKFHFKADDGDDIRGSFTPDAISETRPASTPSRYEATIERKFKKVMATDDIEGATYRLVKLKPIT